MISMCGIIGYTGVQAALSHLLAGLSALEYLGYDSTGISVSLPEINRNSIIYSIRKNKRIINSDGKLFFADINIAFIRKI